MAIQHMDNFSIYGGTNTAAVNRMLNGVWAEITGTGGFLVTDPDPNSTGVVLKWGNASESLNHTARFVLSSNQSIVGSAARYYFSEIPRSTPSNYRLVEVRNISNVNIFNIQMDATGRLGAYKNVAGTNTLIQWTDNPVMTANAWYHVETKFDQTNIEVRIEGITVLNVAHEVSSPVFSQIAFYNSNSVASSANAYLKDLVIWDGSGSNNTNFLGSVIVYSLPPDADVTVGGWTLNGGTSGWEILDNSPPVDATSYIAANQADMPVSPYQGTGPTLPNDITSIRALMTIVRAKKSDGGDGSLQVNLISNGDTANGADRPITTAFTYWRDVFPVDPDTSAAWTVNAANNVVLEINRTL